MTIKLCTDCKWKDVYPTMGASNFCYRPQLKLSGMNVINENINRLVYSCADQRSNERQCGPEAAYFEAKDNEQGEKNDEK